MPCDTKPIGDWDVWMARVMDRLLAIGVEPLEAPAYCWGDLFRDGASPDDAVACFADDFAGVE